MLEYNEITVGKFIIFDEEPWEVIDSHVFRKQQRKPVNATKLKNMITGRVTEYSFHQSEKAEEAEIENKDIQFIYESKGEYWFHEVGNPGKRFALTKDQVGNPGKFLKKDTVAKAMVFDEKIIGVKLPVKMELKVVEAPPGTKGNTAQGGSKQVTLETGAKIHVPMFIEAGQVIRINTENEEYTDKVN
jgi:elongation factor P